MQVVPVAVVPTFPGIQCWVGGVSGGAGQQGSLGKAVLECQWICWCRGRETHLSFNSGERVQRAMVVYSKISPV